MFYILHQINIYLHMRHTFSLLVYFSIFCLSAQDSIVIYFNFNSYILDENARTALSKLKNSEDSISGVYGFTDPVGSVEYNRNLAIQRVGAVCNYLKISNPISEKEASIGELFQFSPLNNENRKVIIRTKVKDLTALSLEEKLKDAKIGDKIIMKALNFQPGLAILLPESLPILNDLFRQMINNKNLIIEIQGHICCTTNDYFDLSTDRSKSVYDFLISKGISKNRMTYVGFGVTNPLFKIPENNETEQISNRRVEIKIISL